MGGIKHIITNRFCVSAIRHKRVSRWKLIWQDIKSLFMEEAKDGS